MKTRTTLTLLSLSAAAALLLTTGCKKEASTAGQGQEMPVDVALPEVESVVIHKNYPGYLTADKEVALVARVNGYLVAHPFNGGDFIKKGTVLFEIEPDTYADAVKSASAQLETAKSNAIYYRQQFAAMEKALASEAVSQMEYEQAKSNLKSAEASIRAAEANLQSARTTLGYCTVRAPFDGHISSSIYSTGTYLSGAGAPVTLANIYDDSKMTANFFIEDARYLELVNEKSVKLKDDLSKMPINFTEPLPHQYTADLSYMAPKIDKTTGTMKIEAKIRNPYNELKSGMYFNIALPFDIVDEAVLIKDASIGTDQLGKFIYVVNDSNQVVYTPIEVGETVRDSLRIVTKGLNKGDKYVTKALLKVRDGMTVKPVLNK